MKNIWLLLFIFSSCTHYNYIDSGICDPRFEGSMMEYLKSDPNNWDSIVKIINRAELTAMFEQEEITFLGPTNITIKKWFYWDDKNGGFTDEENYIAHGFSSIADIPVELCRKIVLSHVIQGKYLKERIARIEYNEKGEKKGGGNVLTTIHGNKVWLWTIQQPYMNIPDMGPIELNMASLKEDEVYKNIGIASSDIHPDNGVVHSLPYSYNLGELTVLME